MGMHHPAPAHAAASVQMADIVDDGEKPYPIASPSPLLCRPRLHRVSVGDLAALLPSTHCPLRVTFQMAQVC